MSDFLIDIKPGYIFANKTTGVKFLVTEKIQGAKSFDGLDIWVLRKTTEDFDKSDHFFSESTLYYYFVKVVSPGKIWKELNQ